MWNFKEDSFAHPMRIDCIISKYEDGRHTDYFYTEKFTNLSTLLRVQFPSSMYTLPKKKDMSEKNKKDGKI